MNYYFDTEFIEDFHYSVNYGPGIFKRWKPKAFHYVDLISIGIVSEDGREYYAVSKDFDLTHVWNKHDLQLQGMGDAPLKIYWLRENVLRPLHKDLYQNISGDMKNVDYFHDLSTFSYKNLKRLISIYGKTNKEIAEDIVRFTTPVQKQGTGILENIDKGRDVPIFYAYYADYDWVVFCSLFGRMLDLPRGYPMYCRDLKQLMDDLNLDKEWKDDNIPGDNLHHALSDAKFNMRLHQTIKKIQTFQT